MEMYADRVEYCPLLSRVEYAPHAPLMLENGNRQTDSRMNIHQTVTLHLLLDV